MSSALPPASNEVHLDYDRIKERWPEIGDRIRRRWRKLTADDVAYPDGSVGYLAGILQERYGVDRREALLQVFEFESDL